MKKRHIGYAIAGAAAGAVAIKMLTRAATVNWEDVSTLIPHSDRSNFINVDGIRLHYQEFGDSTAPPVILIHGYTASLYVWHSTAPSLAEAGLRVIAIDLVGYGYSEKPRWFDYSIQSQARVVERFMDRMGIGRATLVGNSYGGAVAATIALDRPERVDRLVLVASVINDDITSHPILRLASVPLVGEVITPFLVDSRALTFHRMRGTFGPARQDLVSDERALSIRRPLSAVDGNRSLLATSRNWSAAHVERDANLITQPTLLVWGDCDTVTPLADGQKLLDKMPDARLVVFKDCGHVPQEEFSEQFVEVVADFCQKCAS